MAFKFFAELTEGELEEIYELMYKYGWIVAEERQKGELPDKAYMEKARIEGELGPLMEYALEEMVGTYNNWLRLHEEDTWAQEIADMAEETGEGLKYLKSLFEGHWNLSYEDELMEALAEAAYGGYRNDEQYLLAEDPEYIINTYGEQFLEYRAKNAETEEEVSRILEIVDDRGVEEYIEQEGLIEELVEWLVYDQGWTLKEYLEDIGDIDYLIEIYGAAIDLEDFARKLYPKYLDRFPGLEDEIADIGKANVFMQEALQSEDISEQIQAFNVGLTTAHHHGQMADHILEVGVGEGERILDDLSSDKNTSEWNKDLRGIGIKT